MKLQHAGTAGLRALDGPGFNRMNEVTVQQTTQGLVQYVKHLQDTGWDVRCGPNSPSLVDQSADFLSHGVVVGFDGRKNSKRCAMHTATKFRSICMSRNARVVCMYVYSPTSLPCSATVARPSPLSMLTMGCSVRSLLHRSRCAMTS
jgi:phosphomannomutase